MQQEPCRDVCIESVGTGVWVSVVFDSSEKMNPISNFFGSCNMSKFQKLPPVIPCHYFSCGDMYCFTHTNYSFFSQTDPPEDLEITTLEDGYFGELALVTHKPRAASIYAVEDVTVAGLWDSLTSHSQ